MTKDICIAKRHSRLRKIVLPLILLIVGLLVWQWNETRLHHFRTVTPDVLYRSAWPQPQNLTTLLHRYNIRTVVNLCLKNEEKSQENNNWQNETQACKALGIRLIHIPLPGDTPPSPEQAKQWLQLVKSPKRFPVLVHCAHGVVRTNAMVAIYRIGVLGEDNKNVLQNLPDFGHDLYCPKRKRLNDFILDWRTHRPEESE